MFVNWQIGCSDSYDGDLEVGVTCCTNSFSSFGPFQGGSDLKSQHSSCLWGFPMANLPTGLVTPRKPAFPRILKTLWAGNLPCASHWSTCGLISWSMIYGAKTPEGRCINKQVHVSHLIFILVISNTDVHAGVYGWEIARITSLVFTLNMILNKIEAITFHVSKHYFDV